MSADLARGSFVTIIMAGGLGKRMKSDLPKVLHQLAGEPLVHHVVRLANSLGSSRILLVVGHKRELVREMTASLGVEWVTQPEQLGTGDAVNKCLPPLDEYDGDVLILSGDVPLLRPETVRNAWNTHLNANAAVTVFTFIPQDASGYGRIIRNEEGLLERIVEEKDASAEERRIEEVNGGIYFYRMADLRESIPALSNDNASGEYYLTDTIRFLRAKGRRVAAFRVVDPWEMAGVNTPEQLSELEGEFLQRQPTRRLTLGR